MAAMVPTSTDVLGAAQGADGARHQRVGASEAGRRPRRDRSLRGHRGVGGRTACPAADPYFGVSPRNCRYRRRLASLARCSGSTTPLRAPRSTSSRARRAASRCTCAARRRTTRRTSATGARRSCSTRSAATCCGRGFEVTYVSNVTDIDDKIIDRAHARGHHRARARRSYELEFWKQMDRLNIMRPDDDAACRPSGSSQMRRSDRRARRAGPRVRDRGRGRVLPGRLAAGVRRAVAPHARGAARERGRARRGRRAQAQPGRLRPVEGRQAGRAQLGVAVGERAGPAGTSSARRCR